MLSPKWDSSGIQRRGSGKNYPAPTNSARIEKVMIKFALLLLVFSWVPYVAVLMLSVWKGRKLLIRSSLLSRWPTVNIVIPTCNEESTIVGKLSEVLELDYPANKCNIVVVDESTDRTPELVGTMQEKYPDRILLFHHNSRLGLAKALHNGYSVSSGEVIVKTDCDAAILDRNALKSAIAYLLDARIGAISGVYTSDSVRERIYRRMLQRWQIAQANLFSTIIAHGCFMAFKKDLYTGLSPTSRADDTEIFVDMMRRGYRTLVVPDILCIERRPLRRWDTILQRSRRAEGILRLIGGTKGLSLAKRNPRAFLLSGLELYLIGFFPFLMLMSASIIMVEVAILGWLGYLIDFGILTAIVELWLHGDNIVASFLDIQLAGGIGLLSVARAPSGLYPRVS
jgi:cellulose synthase/poly-beta-1,6-N-acetylglucosamine synthase-like glycosyltransferase